jgi:hypothetical protein
VHFVSVYVRACVCEHECVCVCEYMCVREILCVTALPSLTYMTTTRDGKILGLVLFSLLSLKYIFEILQNSQLNLTELQRNRVEKQVIINR